MTDKGSTSTTEATGATGTAGAASNAGTMGIGRGSGGGNAVNRHGSGLDSLINLDGAVSTIAPKLDLKLYKLEKHNYTIWKIHTTNVLQVKDLYEAVQYETPDTIKERQARALLTSALSEDNQMKVINCVSAHKIWKRLEALYENKSSFERENLLNKLHSYKIRSAKDISKSVSEMENIAAKLRLLGENVSDESIMSAVLRALPPQFKTFITVWKGTSSAERTIENLLTRLMAEVCDEETEPKALYTKLLEL